MDNEKNWYPKYPSIHVSKENGYPCIHISMYPSIHDIQVSNYPSIQKKIGIQDIQISGYQKKVVSVHPYLRLIHHYWLEWVTLWNYLGNHISVEPAWKVTNFALVPLSWNSISDSRRSLEDFIIFAILEKSHPLTC